MSFHHFAEAKKLMEVDRSVYTLIMAALFKADPTNRAKIKAAWPELEAEWEARYWEGDPRGRLPGEAPSAADEETK